MAKQASTIDRLSGGRLRLGVGVGWNDLEFEALGQEFANRGRRIEEQIDVLRALWTNQTVEFAGEFHSVPDMGINPLPSRTPIPLWYGSAGADKVLRRVARVADGWMPESRAPETIEPQLEKLRSLVDLRAASWTRLACRVV